MNIGAIQRNILLFLARCNKEEGAFIGSTTKAEELRGLDLLQVERALAGLTKRGLVRKEGIRYVASGAALTTVEKLKYSPGALLDVFENGRWVHCVILRIAEYVGKSGPGYYAAHDPPSPSCASFWCNDRMLRSRANASRFAAEQSR